MKKIQIFFYHSFKRKYNFNCCLEVQSMALPAKYFMKNVITKEKLFALSKIRKVKFLVVIPTLILIKVININQGKKIVLYIYLKMTRQFQNRIVQIIIVRYIVTIQNPSHQEINIILLLMINVIMMIKIGLITQVHRSVIKS